MFILKNQFRFRLLLIASHPISPSLEKWAISGDETGRYTNQIPSTKKSEKKGELPVRAAAGKPETRDGRRTADGGRDGDGNMW